MKRTQRRSARTALIGLLATLLAAIALLTWLFDEPPHSVVDVGAELARGSAGPQAELELDAELDADGDEQDAGATERAATVAEEALARRRPERVTEGRVTGRVVAEDGSALEGARVFAASNDKGPGAPLDAAAWEGRKSRRTTLTRADGGFAFEKIEAGTLRLAVRMDGFAPLDLDSERVPAAPEFDLGLLELERGVVLAGMVVDADGRGVAGASVIRARDATAPMRARSLEDCGAVVATSDERGAFRIACQAAGPWNLLAHAEGHLDAVASGVLTPAGTHDESLVLRLGRAAPIAGTVRFSPGPGAPPLDSVVVRVRRVEPGETSLAGAQFTHEATCDSAGRFQVAGLIEGDLYSLTARAPTGVDKDWREFRPTVEANAGEAGVEIAVGLARVLVLRAVDAQSGEPLSELDAELSVDGGPRSGTRMSVALTKLGDGRRRLVTHDSAEPSDVFALELSARGYRTQNLERLSLEPGSESALAQIDMLPLGIARVRLLDAETGAPIRGGRVLAELTLGDDGQRALEDVPPVRTKAERVSSEKSGRDGIAELYASPGAQALASASHDEFARSASFEIEFLGRDAAPFDVRLDRGGMAQVLVRDARGAPLAGATVYATTNLDNAKAPGASVQVSKLSRVTDAQGVCLFDALAPARYQFRLEVERLGTLPRNQVDPTSALGEVLANQTLELELRDRPRMRVSGRVTEAGQALVGARVTLGASAEADQERSYPGNWRNRVPVTSDANGRYEASGLGPGRWSVAVEHPTRLVPFIANVELTDADEELDLVLPRGAILGRVIDEDGHGVSGARVRLGVSRRERDGSSFTPLLDGRAAVTTNSAGNFELRGLPAGQRLLLEASLRGFQIARSDALQPAVDETIAGVELVLRPGARIEVQLTNELSQPLRAFISARRAGVKDRAGPNDARYAASNSRGYVALEGLAPGEWRISAWRRREDSEAAPVHEVKAAAGASARLEIEVATRP